MYSSLHIVPMLAYVVPRKPRGINDPDWGQFCHWLAVSEMLNKKVRTCPQFAAAASVILFHFPSLPQFDSTSQRLLGWKLPFSISSTWLQNLRQRFVLPIRSYDADTNALHNNAIAFRPTWAQLAEHSPWYISTYRHLMQTRHQLCEQCEQDSAQMLQQLDAPPVNMAAAADVLLNMYHFDGAAAVIASPATSF
eukprot:TRINITY_DN4155_c0_g1_i1.p1 TRINITY_DN4155_c0_g1~~TRINITY_DN4155_c0_g1_i1.p1  ORF type:complete len:194 (+),score=23.15 TRINITY_DN4155_c0_g1_i1:133-714(+)